jgi:hypothetical protein
MFHRLWAINHVVLELSLWIEGVRGHYDKLALAVEWKQIRISKHYILAEGCRRMCHN